jgi:hypothetical protein
LVTQTIFFDHFGMAVTFAVFFGKRGFFGDENQTKLIFTRARVIFTRQWVNFTHDRIIFTGQWVIFTREQMIFTH